jgi:diacylglycerol kinase family enzyme
MEASLCAEERRKRFDNNNYLEYHLRMSTTYSSNQAAKKLGLPVSTLSTYIGAGKIKPPKSVTTGGITVYLWTDADIERIRKLLPKIANGRKTRWQKQKK